MVPGRVKCSERTKRAEAIFQCRAVVQLLYFLLQDGANPSRPRACALRRSDLAWRLERSDLGWSFSATAHTGSAPRLRGAEGLERAERIAEPSHRKQLECLQGNTPRITQRPSHRVHVVSIPHGCWRHPIGSLRAAPEIAKPPALTSSVAARSEAKACCTGPAWHWPDMAWHVAQRRHLDSKKCNPEA